MSVDQKALAETIAPRLEGIRRFMARQKLDAFIVPCADQFLVEYLGPEVQRLRWLTGFSGEAAVAVVMPERAAIFVDGRFTVQVRQQVPAELFEYHHLIEEPHLEWLATTLDKGAKLGFDPTLHTYSWYQQAGSTLEKQGIHLEPLAENPIDSLWIEGRPEPSSQPGMLLEEQYTGCSSADKRIKLANIMQKENLDAMVITQPDSVNWLLNIRGADVPCLPVVLGFAIVYRDGRADLFTQPGKLDTTLKQHAGEDVGLYSLGHMEEKLIRLGEQQANVQIDFDNTNAWIATTLATKGAHLKAGSDPCMEMKACKNEVEIGGMRQAHIMAGIATCRFMAWLDHQVEQKQHAHLDEGVLAEKLEGLLAEAPNYKGCSFETISALGPNAAMCHYNHTLVEPRAMGSDGMYLIDSGGQYLEGTTDMTRTIKIGEVSAEMRQRYTQVLQGHIRLAATIFPMGTLGVQLDPLARWPLWQSGCDYDHGTGHGVGQFLSVHEDPPRLSNRDMTSRIKPGMMVTIEPGYYKADGYGIRVENLYLAKEVDCQGDRPMLGFESLTLIPIDCRLIDMTLMTEADIKWLDDYHREVCENMSAHLQGDELAWLKRVTRPLAEQI